MATQQQGTQQGTTDVAGSLYLNHGMNSWDQPTALPDSQFTNSMNTVCRGGKVRTRPGTAIIADLPGRNCQGGRFFAPSTGTAAYVAAVDGKVYVSLAPFRHFHQLANVQFSPSSQFVTMTATQQLTDYDNAGNIFFLAVPRPILIMQDSVTRAAYWDGVNSGHIDPTPSGSNITVPGKDGTRVGLWSCWSNNRLWISRDNQVFASDIGNPLKFTETQYLASARAFYLPDNCTGIIETPDRSGIICFTQNDGTLLLSSIQDRTLWVSTKDFQKTILPTSGCIAPRSLVNQYGLTWWFSPTGLQNLNSALNQNITSVISYQDTAMAISKQNIGSDMSGICVGYHENYLLVSVPSGDNYNRHTWALDQIPVASVSNIAVSYTNTWTSYWTGWRPVEWSRAVVGGQQVVFFVSKDYDGVVRVWQAFLDSRTDNGCPITCFLQTKQHNFGDVFRKKWRYSRAFLSDLWGSVAYRWFALPHTGAPFEIGHKDIEATAGQVYDDQNYGGTLSGFDHSFASNRPQTRLVYSEAGGGGAPGAECTACGVEKESTDNLDYAFGMLLVWSGELAVDGYQIFVTRDAEKESGRCEPDEVAPRSVDYQGCGDTSYFPDGTIIGTPWSATATVCVDDTDDSTSDSDSESGSTTIICSTQTKTSVISQKDADRKAYCAARFDAEFQAEIYL